MTEAELGLCSDGVWSTKKNGSSLLPVLRAGLEVC